MPATSNSELDQRVSTVADWILEGRRYSELVASCCGEFKVVRRTAENYIDRANPIAREVRARQKETMITRAADKFERIHDKAIAREDCSAATGAVRELVKLLGLAEPDKQEVKHDVTDPIKALLNNTVNNPDQPRPRGN
jgi:hypothetical protein